ncbi:LLM class flavin-dependent oxidoreductase [Nocardioides guangzhouensis]|uniref:LLM class flavin-dependent oxidoreductase n=1 Tax=Nocardioides guangzhouensis TaxID=2497878 RepID=A0A4Q4ZD52_9ACTN|nr:LLM class flavin-dependent oxidoreductase [Nocardioides guangzhouensis]RYP85658.1 LLM class flavin-dependent oxidoreductase [Nocardioides guangzhouensis]
MEYGAHLPQVDLDGRGWDPGGLTSYARTARELGFRALSANDHLVFRRPWLDGIVALASVVEASGDLTLATTVALPVVRGPAALAKAAAALDLLSGGRVVLGVGPGSSPEDYALAGVPFEERWPRFDASVVELRGHLRGGPDVPALEPRSRPEGPPIWIGSWGSAAGLRRAARLGDGWLASAYNTSPEVVAAGRREHGLACSVATMWTYVTDDERVRAEQLGRLAAMLGRSESDLAGRVMVGPAEECAALLTSYADAGVDTLYVWPLADHERQLERVIQEVVPLTCGP